MWMHRSAGGSRPSAFPGHSASLRPTLANTSLGQFPTVPGAFQTPLGLSAYNPFLSQLGLGLTFVR